MAKKDKKDAATETKAPKAASIETTEPSIASLVKQAIQHRLEFVWLFWVKMGLPNGDPDAANAPRVDHETGHGFITSVCIKRWIRDQWIRMFHGNGEVPEGKRIYVMNDGVLNDAHRDAFRAIGIKGIDDNLTDKEFGGKLPAVPRGDEPLSIRAMRWMCQNFLDVATFGAMMATSIPIKQVTGPVQIMPAVSLHPITMMDPCISRVAVTTREEKESGKDHMLGHQNMVPWALYRAHGFINPLLAERTGFDEEMQNDFFASLMNCFDMNRSASRGEMASAGLWTFEHALKLGNARAADLFDLIKVEQNDPSKPPRSYADFTETVDEAGVPEGVTLKRLI